MPLSIRTRFEVLKRDNFTCRYCGGKSPEVVLEVDHILPLCEGGTDDPLNLTAACWACNRGKSGVPLDAVMDAENPHDRAVMILERERQMKEYNEVLKQSRHRRLCEAWDLIRHWENDPELGQCKRSDLTWLMNALEWCPSETIRNFMDIAIDKNIGELRYVKGCVRNLRESEGV